MQMRRYKYLIGSIYLFAIILAGCTENIKINKDTCTEEIIVQENIKPEKSKQEIASQESITEVDVQDEADRGSIEEVIYISENYGEIQEYGGEFYYDEETKGFYYNIESFYLNSDFLYTMNDTLEKFYDEYLNQYLNLFVI